MSHFLKKAVNSLKLKPVYYTPKKVKEYIIKHKLDFLIINPPFK